MKVPVERLKQQQETELTIRPETHQEAALRVLASDPENAYSPSQIEEEAEIPDGSGAKVLSRLVEKGAVGSLDGFYYINQDILSEIRVILGDIHQRHALKEIAASEENGEITPETESYTRVTDAEVEAELQNIKDDI